MKKNYRIILSMLLLNGGLAWAQTDTPEAKDLMEMSLEELMNVEVVSASKKSESLFDSPLSASVLTKEEIQKAGCTSIMEAFKLMPGLIVREQTNGNFDIHLRGMNSLLRTGSMAHASNVTTLVMIDGRPVYSYLQGGTFWETLPIDINDVEKIEIVRGPSAAMYGPNAVSGVINIITRKMDQDRFYATANAQRGTHQTSIANASAGYKITKNLDVLLSGNFQHRERTQTSYYELWRNIWLDNPDSLLSSRTGTSEGNLQAKFADPSLAMHKYGFNTFLNFTPADKYRFSVAAGLQDSKVQKAYYESSSTPLTTSACNSKYVDVRGDVGKLFAQFSYLDGTYTTQVGGPGLLYDFKTLDAVLEYTFTFKNLSLKPGLNFRNSITDDKKYSDEQKRLGTFVGSNFNGHHEIMTKAASLRADYSALSNKLRLIGALRVDKFNEVDKPYLSYQFVANYKLNEKNIFRAVASRSNQSPNINDSYVNILSTRTPVRVNGQIKPGHFIERRVLGNTNLAMLTADMIELGYRRKISDNLQIDVDLFTVKHKDDATVIMGKNYQEIKGPGDTVTVVPTQYQNIPMVARQVGATISVNYVVNTIQIKPYVTFQQTRLYDYTDFSNTSDAAPSPNPKTGNLGDPLNNNMYSGIGTMEIHKGTPAVYGGAFINYQLNAKFNFNFNPYLYSGSTYYHRFTDFRDGERGVDYLSSKVQINAKVSYTPIKSLSIFISGKNMLNNKAREFYRTDVVGASYLAGVHYEF